MDFLFFPFTSRAQICIKLESQRSRCGQTLSSSSFESVRCLTTHTIFLDKFVFPQKSTRCIHHSSAIDCSIATQKEKQYQYFPIRRKNVAIAGTERRDNQQRKKREHEHKKRKTEEIWVCFFYVSLKHCFSLLGKTCIQYMGECYYYHYGREIITIIIT